MIGIGPERQDPPPQRVVVTDFDVSFWQAVTLMVKLAIAAIPAAIILGIIWAVVWVVFHLIAGALRSI